MSLSIYDAEVFALALKKGRKKNGLTQAACAELLGHSLSFQKDLERGRCSISLEGFFDVCRVLNISADDCIFHNNHKTDSCFYSLLRLISQCNENSLRVLIATAEALIRIQQESLDASAEYIPDSGKNDKSTFTK